MLPILKRIGPSPRPLTIQRGIVTSAREPLVGIKKNEDPPPGDYHKIDRSVLDGGVKVLSVNTPTPTTTLSLFVKAGSRYENRVTSNSARFLKHLAFKGTNEKSALRLIRDLEHIGANYTSEATRETVSYHIRGIRNTEKSDSVNLNIIVETLRYILNPLLLEYELRTIKPVVSREASILNADPEKRVTELLHSEGFQDSGLGLPLISEFAVSEVTGQKIHDHVSKFYYPGDRITIVGTGIEHSHLISKLTPLFTNPTLKGRFHELWKLPPLPNEPPTPQTPNFVGGSTLRIPDLGNTHVGIAFPGSAVSKKDYVALEVLREILGGGDKDRVRGYGNPGTSISSRFSRNILSKNPNILEISTFNFGYSDAGLFGVYASGTPGYGRDLTKSIISELHEISSGITPEEFQQGRLLVKKQFLFNVTNDSIQLANHLAFVGTSVVDHIHGIDSITVDDVRKVAKTLFSVAPVLVSVGDVRGVPKLSVEMKK